MQTFIVTVDVLLFRFGSGVVEVTFAVLFIVVIHLYFVLDDTTLPLIIIVIEALAGNVPISKLPGHGLKVNPPFIENSGLIISGGIVSVTTTFWAAAGPALDTTIV